MAFKIDAFLDVADAGSWQVASRAAWLATWLLPAAVAFDKALDEFRNADGIILDLRGNIGGVAGMVMGLIGGFFPAIRAARTKPIAAMRA